MKLILCIKLWKTLKRNFLHLTSTQILNSVAVIFLELRPSVQVVVQPSGAALVAGNNVSLACNVTLSGGTINSVWNVSTNLMRNGAALSSAQFTANVSSLDSSYSTAVYLLSPLRITHRGTYQCLVSATIAGVQSTVNSSLTITVQCKYSVNTSVLCSYFLPYSASTCNFSFYWSTQCGAVQGYFHRPCLLNHNQWRSRCPSKHHNTVGEVKRSCYHIQ